MKTLKRAALISLLTLTTVASGMFLQCASDPAIAEDGGIMDTILVDTGIRDFLKDRGITDSIGPKADAAPGSATRTVYKGKTDSSGDFQTCAKQWKGDDPPVVTVWLSSNSDMSFARVATVGDLRINNGCLKYDANIVAANQYIRLAVID